MAKHSHEAALNEEEFNRLIEATAELREPFASETLFILVAGGRLGMRAGEISHTKREWVNWERSLIEVPSYSKCRCGYCRYRAERRAKNDEDLSFEMAFKQRWQPKTRKAVRAIPFDFDPEVAAVIEVFFDHYDEYEHSRTSVNRRVDRVAEAAGMNPDNLFPHALRATAATYHAYRGVPPVAMQSFFGWSNLAVAQKYLRLSGSSTAKALKKAHLG